MGIAIDCKKHLLLSIEKSYLTCVLLSLIIVFNNSVREGYKENKELIVEAFFISRIEFTVKIHTEKEKVVSLCFSSCPPGAMGCG